MKESEYNKIELGILMEIESLLRENVNSEKLKEIQNLRAKLRQLRLDNLDKSNIDNLNTI